LLLVVFTLLAVVQLAESIDSASAALFIVPIGLALAIIAAIAPSGGGLRVHVLVPAVAAIAAIVWTAFNWGGTAFASHTVASWFELLGSFTAFVLVTAGAVSTWRSRVLGLRYYRFATLISIFYSQVFAFYQLQFGAIAILLLYVLILAGIRGLLENERKQQPAATVPAGR
jgi:hypothetical protein